MKMYIAKNFFNINNIIPSNKKIKEGDILPYSIIRRIDDNRALVRIMGQKLLANMGKEVNENGFAKVISVADKIRLTVIKDNLQSNIDNIIIKGITSSVSKEVFNMLLDAGLKASDKNIAYLDLILKHLPNLSSIEHGFIFTAISKEVYFTVYELKNIFNANIFRIIFDKIKKSNESYFDFDNNNVVDMPIFDGNIDSKGISEYILKNSNMSLWFTLFEKLHKDLDSDSIVLFLKLFALNKKNKFFKNNVYLFPIPLFIDGRLLEINMFIDGLDDKLGKKTFLFRVHEGGSLFFDIKIDNLDESGFDIFVFFYRETLYNEFLSIKDDVRLDMETIEKKYNILIDLGFLYEKGE